MLQAAPSLSKCRIASLPGPRDEGAVHLTRIALTDFRNYRDLRIEPAPGFVLLSGPNGAGKTNLLEAVSMLAPGRGLRGTPLSEMARHDGAGGFAVSGELDGGATLGTGTLADAPDRRQLRINGAAASVNALSEWLAILWLTPAMDRLFSGSAGDRRRFLDRLVLALDPGHARHASRYEAAMRARNKLLAEGPATDPGWLTALETAMAEHGAALAGARERTVVALDAQLATMPEDEFARAEIALEGWVAGDLAAQLRANRARDQAAGRAVDGPHRQDLAVIHRTKGMPAAKCSTGEQKALLLNLVLAHGDVVADRRGAPPILLLDEVAAHLDPVRRSALYRRLEGRGQIWMTATEPSLFEGLSGASHFHVEAGSATPI